LHACLGQRRREVDRAIEACQCLGDAALSRTGERKVEVSCRQVRATADDAAERALGRRGVTTGQVRVPFFDGNLG
jgi:hypothetical protein